MQQLESKTQQLIRQIETLIYHINAIEDYEQQVLLRILQDQEYEELRNMNISLAECHAIDCIERNTTMNTTGIAKKMGITKGGISKITAKLVKKKLIEAQRLANNQKEVYYVLTPLGRQVFHLHESLHEQAQEKFHALFRAYSDDELRLASKFMQDLIALFQSNGHTLG